MMDFNKNMQAMQSVLINIIRVGVVSSIDEATATAKVAFKEFSGDIVSYDLPILVKQSLANKDYWMPDINEQVLCIFLPTGMAQGFILGAIYSDVDKPETIGKDIRRVKFSDGTIIEYDRAAHKLTANCVGDVVVTCKNLTVNVETKATITAPLTEINGDVKVNGKIEATGEIQSAADVKAVSVSLKNHRHGGVTGGESNTLPPNA